MASADKREQPVISFASGDEWAAWLEEHHAASAGIWLKFHKKGSGLATVTYKEALDVALCYGWIDGQLKTFDVNSYLQKFTPRRPASTWSKRNIGHVARLEKEGRMRPSGVKAVEAAKTDGRWDTAYDSPGNMSPPVDLLEALKKDSETLVFFESLNKTNKYSIAWRLQTAKTPKLREQRMRSIIGMLERREKFHE